MMMVRKIVLLLFLCNPVIGFAKCNDFISGLLEQLHGSRNSTMASCKVWAADKSKTIVVLPLPQNSGENDSYDLDILLVDSQTGELISRLWQTAALDSDAVRLENVIIDTGRYMLNPQTRAFGLRANYQGSSRANPFSQQTLSLYVQQGERLIRIADWFPIEQHNGEWDTKCQGEFTSSKSVLAVDSRMTQGYADLLILEKKVNWLVKEKDDDCIESTSDISKQTIRLKYDGNQYRKSKRN